MGVDLIAVTDIGLEDASPAMVLAALQSSYEETHKLWHGRYELPVNAGFKVLNLEKFREAYTSNWTMSEATVKRIKAHDDISEVDIIFDGPYGWRAELRGDTMIVDLGMRWKRFCSDKPCKQLIIASISLIAITLSSSRVCFFPDSSYCDSECTDSLREKGNFNAVYDCLKNRRGELQVLLHSGPAGAEFVALVSS